MSYKDKYKKYHQSRGTTIQEERVQDSKRFFEQGFKDSPSYEEVYINALSLPSTPLESPTPVQIVYNGKNPNMKSLLTYPGVQVYAGDLIIRKNRERWLCTYLDINVIHASGTIQKCNENLRWIDEYGVMQSYPIVLEGSTSIGVDEDNIINLPAGQRVALVSNNMNTRKLRRDDRFIFGKEAFTVIDFDYITQEGILKLSFKSDGINEATDNLDLGIADYYNKLNNLEIILAEPNVLELEVGKTEKIDLRVVNQKGEVDVPVVFSSSDDSVVEVDSNGFIKTKKVGEASIVMTLPNEYSKSIKIKVFEEAKNNYRAEILGPDFIVYKKTAEYIVNYYNNNIPESHTTLFTLSDQTGNPTTKAKIVSQNANNGICVIEAGAYSKFSEIVVLNAVAIDGNISIKKHIKLTSYT